MQREPEQECKTPYELACLHKYFMQDFNTLLIHKIELCMIRAKGEYDQDKREYDCLFSVCEKYKINLVKYLKFCVYIDGTRRIADMIKPATFLKYANYNKKKQKYTSIYKNFVKSAENIAQTCIENKFNSSVDYLRMMIKENRLGYEYFTGRISKHFLASISNIEKIIEKMDGQNHEELGIILSEINELRKITSDALLEIRGKVIHPISFTDSLIKEKLTASNKTASIN